MMQLINITAGYHGVPVLRDVSLELPQGSLTVLIGPNGSGKSTLLKTAAGLIRPAKGEIWLNGKPAAEYTPKEFARRVALLPQQRAIPELTVRELVSHGRYPHMGFPRILAATDCEVVEDALLAVRMQSMADQPLESLSGGERQRAYVAMLLAQQAELLLLDEPTVHMDIGCQLELLELIKELHARRKTLLVVMHDLAHALTLNARLCLMEKGQIAALGSAEALLDSGAIECAFGVRVVRMMDADGRERLWFEQK